MGTTPLMTKIIENDIKIFIEGAMVYNLIREGEEYSISAKSFRKGKDYGYAYELNQISNQVEYQIRGKGRIK